jgi:hypothetical protein
LEQRLHAVKQALITVAGDLYSPRVKVQSIGLPVDFGRLPGIHRARLDRKENRSRAATLQLDAMVSPQVLLETARGDVLFTDPLQLEAP